MSDDDYGCTGRGALLWLVLAWCALLIGTAAWHSGAGVAAVTAAVLYFGAGGLAAFALPDWRSKTFQSRRLAPNAPDAPGLNVRLTSALVFALVLLLWPLYWRMTVLDGRERQARGNTLPDRRGGNQGQTGG